MKTFFLFPYAIFLPIYLSFGLLQPKAWGVPLAPKGSEYLRLLIEAHKESGKYQSYIESVIKYQAVLSEFQKSRDPVEHYKNALEAYKKAMEEYHKAIDESHHSGFKNKAQQYYQAIDRILKEVKTVSGSGIHGNIAQLHTSYKSLEGDYKNYFPAGALHWASLGRPSSVAAVGSERGKGKSGGSYDARYKPGVINSATKFHKNKDAGFDITLYDLFDWEEDPIDFYHSYEKYYEFANFFTHEVEYEGSKFPTSEHAFQAAKFKKESSEFKGLAAGATMGAFKVGQLAYPKGVPVHTSARYGSYDGWKQNRNHIMYEILLQKFAKGSALGKKLDETRNRLITEWTDLPPGITDDSKIDKVWGTSRRDYQGKNHLGKLLMLVRAVNRGKMIDAHRDAILDGLASD